jgi:predicted O-methyltransferase YrrM
LLRPWRDVVPGDGPAICTSLTEDEAGRLGELAAGKRVLEVGSAHGYSAVVMALAGAISVDAVDDHSGGTWLGDTYATMVSNLRAYGVRNRVMITRGRSQDVLPAVAAEGDWRFGLIFIDGDHTYWAVRQDILNALPLLEPGGTLAVHDYREDNCPDVARAVDEVFPAGPGSLTGTLFVVTP